MMIFKKIIIALFASSLLAGCQTSGSSNFTSGNYAVYKKQKGIGVYIQRKSVQTSCFPTKLKKILYDISKLYNKPVVITSGHRSKARSKRKRSQHIACKAADIRVPGVSSNSIITNLRNNKIDYVGGTGKYRKQPGLIHVDVGPKRAWNY